jgi:hypothetical protein
MDGIEQVGHVYVFSGATSDTLYTLSSLEPRTQGHFGYQVGALGDADGDGMPDLAVGAPGEGTSGRVYVFSGATSDTLYTLVHPTGSTQAAFGFAVVGAGDVDGDGRGDVIVGVEADGPPNAPTDLSGRAYVFSGADGVLGATLLSPNAESGGHFGNAVAALGDVDGDGRADVIVGAVLEEQDLSPEGAGRVYLFSGFSHPVANEPPPIAAGLRLQSAYPNPARSTTTIPYEIDRSSAVRLAVYDVLGRTVAVLVDGSVAAGVHEATLDASALAPGVYFVRLEVAGALQTSRVTLLR